MANLKAVDNTDETGAESLLGALTGRAADTAALHGAVEVALDGAGGVVLVCGEAGIGKSTLVAAVAGAQSLGRTTVIVRADEFLLLEPLGALRDAEGLPAEIAAVVAESSEVVRSLDAGWAASADPGNPSRGSIAF